MQELQLFNSLTKNLQIFKPIKDGYVGMYTCGPTIYDYPTIGNWRTYTLSDILYRTLKYLGYDVKYVMNLTDVGHLSGDNLGDTSQGVDRMSKSAEAQGVDAWAIASKYEKDFLDTFKLLNLVMPDVVCRATDHITEQIELIKKIESKGYTYVIDDGVYFDVAKYEKDGNKYGELSNIDELSVQGTRINPNEQKKDPRDFALWKFFATGQKRHNMQWQSPWGLGFPGWHIECSAMSMKYLGEQFDLHLGGEDLKSTHHPNEIAQAESATGHKPFVKYWVHGAFLQVDGGRMGKSIGNAYTVHDVIKKGIEPIALRYFYLTGKYNSKLNFTWQALESAQSAYHKLIAKVSVVIGDNATQNDLSEIDLNNNQRQHINNDFILSNLAQKYLQQFNDAVCDDLNMPVTVAVIWELIKDKNIDQQSKLYLIAQFDRVLGLNLLQNAKAQMIQKLKTIEDNKNYPPHIIELIKQRKSARAKKDWQTADKLRKQLIELGVNVVD